MAPEFVGGSMFLLKQGEKITVNDPRLSEPIVIEGTGTQKGEGIVCRLSIDEKGNGGILQTSGKTLYINKDTHPDLFKLIEEGNNPSEK